MSTDADDRSIHFNRQTNALGQRLTVSTIAFAWQENLVNGQYSAFYSLIIGLGIAAKSVRFAS